MTATVIQLADYRRARDTRPAPKPQGKSHDCYLVEFFEDLLETGRWHSDWDSSFMVSICTDLRYRTPAARLTARQRDQAWRIIGRAMANDLFGAPEARPVTA
jgi:hypothetical protein